MADLQHYYYQQVVAAVDLIALQENLEDADNFRISDNFQAGVRSGFNVVEHAPTPSMAVDVQGPSVAYDTDGSRIYLPSLVSVDVSVDTVGSPTGVVGVGATKWLSVFVAFERISSDLHTDGNDVPVHFRFDESFTVIVDQGAEVVGSPARPPLRNAAVLIADILIAEGQTQVFNGDIESRDIVSSPNSRFEFSYNLIATSPFIVREGLVSDAIQAVITELNSITVDIGTNATDIGTNATAIGVNATAIGVNATDIGNNATAIGVNATAIGVNATAIGVNATDIGVNATDIGNNATAIGVNATAIGVNATDIGNNATDIGNNATAIGVNATAIGNHISDTTAHAAVDVTYDNTAPGAKLPAADVKEALDYIGNSFARLSGVAQTIAVNTTISNPLVLNSTLTANSAVVMTDSVTMKSSIGVSDRVERPHTYSTHTGLSSGRYDIGTNTRQGTFVARYAAGVVTTTPFTRLVSNAATRLDITCMMARAAQQGIPELYTAQWRGAYVRPTGSSFIITLDDLYSEDRYGGFPIGLELRLTGTQGNGDISLYSGDPGPGNTYDVMITFTQTTFKIPVS